MLKSRLSLMRRLTWMNRAQALTQRPVFLVPILLPASWLSSRLRVLIYGGSHRRIGLPTQQEGPVAWIRQLKIDEYATSHQNITKLSQFSSRSHSKMLYYNQQNGQCNGLPRRELSGDVVVFPDATREVYPVNWTGTGLI